MFVPNETIRICGAAVTAYPREKKSLNANWKIIKLNDGINDRDKFWNGFE